MGDDMHQYAREVQACAEASYRRHVDQVERLKKDLREERDRAKKVESALQSAVAHVSDLATKLGEAEGKLMMSKTVGVVEGWRDRCRKLEEALREIEMGLPAGSTILGGRDPMWRDAYRDLQRIARAALASGDMDV